MHRHKQASTDFDWLLIAQFQDLVLEYSQIDITSTNSTNSTDFGGVGYRGRQRNIVKVHIWINESSGPIQRTTLTLTTTFILSIIHNSNTQNHTHKHKYHTHLQKLSSTTHYILSHTNLTDSHINADMHKPVDPDYGRWTLKDYFALYTHTYNKEYTQRVHLP